MGVTFPTVEKACVCLDLKTGTIILGVINLIGCIIGALVSIAILIGFAVLGDPRKESDELFNQVDPVDVGIVSIVFIICVFYIIIASLLIHGARTGRPGFLTPWLVLTVISIGLQVLDAVVGLISFQWGETAGTILGLLIEAYIFVCVWSLRKQQQKEDVWPKA